MLDRQDRPRKTEETKRSGTSLAQKLPNRQRFDCRALNHLWLYFVKLYKLNNFQRFSPTDTAVLCFPLFCHAENPSHEDWPLDAFHNNSFLASDNNLETMHGGFCQKREGNCSSPGKKEGTWDLQARVQKAREVRKLEPKPGRLTKKARCAEPLSMSASFS